MHEAKTIIKHSITIDTITVVKSSKQPVLLTAENELRKTKQSGFAINATKRTRKNR